ncbi:hypothetical protein DFJ58DRAFT_846664 [Suillus subalutaceus]|uniref:uncharacterized protein n=1 Tax=Suillus subalutaceus TaxID=48586 RepID=UPI001B8725F9|nr:uncharacterized protein DFJ58DRAFT_846664 [Suillus subalutaceus]KAG1836971.1 hypothetical protein DFJ58DRAFT_846664 [Suillus subalutaceus]
MRVARLCSLGWVVPKVEAAGFKVKNIDVLGIALFCEPSAPHLQMPDDDLSDQYKIRDIVDATPHPTLVQYLTAHVYATSSSTVIHCLRVSFPRYTKLKPSGVY